jgi:hypothetical protein
VVTGLDPEDGGVHVFIDESGPFAIPTDGSTSICCVAALAVGERDLPAVLEGTDRIVAGWSLAPGEEPKGRQLPERRVDRVITHLTNFDVVLTVLTTDMGQHSSAEIESHKQDQVDRIRHSADGPVIRRPPSGGRIRHGARFQRWRDDKPPAECTVDQIDR